MMAGTDRSRPIAFDPCPAVVLCEPQLGENIGTAARAMANFGLWDLRLVAPRDGWPNEKARAAASRADHVIDRVRVFDTLAEAVADLSQVFATTARKRELAHEVIGPDEGARRLFAHISGGGRSGIVFGREKWGLYNEEVALCDTIVTLPVDPAFASLNIAQAVLILAYEWRRESTRAALPFATPVATLASKEELLGMCEQIEGALDRSGFFKTPEKRPTFVSNLRTMLGKAGFSDQDVRTLRGIIASIDRRHERPNPNRPQSRYLKKR
jgi:tRNA/rRNA methyltransferase